MTILRGPRKVFSDEKVWYHTDYMCRREVTKIGRGGRRDMLKFIGARPDPFGSPVICGVAR